MTKRLSKGRSNRQRPSQALQRIRAALSFLLNKYFLAAVVLLSILGIVILFPRLIISVLRTDPTLSEYLPGIDILSAQLVVAGGIASLFGFLFLSGKTKDIVAKVGRLYIAVVCLIVLFSEVKLTEHVSAPCYGIETVASPDTILVNVAYYDGQSSVSTTLNTWVTQLQNEISETIKSQGVQIQSLPNYKTVQSEAEATAINNCSGGAMTIYWGGVGENSIEVYYHPSVSDGYLASIPRKSYLRGSDLYSEIQSSYLVVSKSTYRIYLESAGDSPYILALLVGYIQNERGNFEGAIATLTEAINIASFDRAESLGLNAAYTFRRISYLSLGLDIQALADANTAVSISPDSDSYLSRAYVFAGMGRNQEALDDLNTAIELAPSSSTAYSMRGYWYALSGKYDVAVSDYNKAIELNPNDDSSYISLSALNVVQGNYDEALTNINTAIDIATSNRQSLGDALLARLKIYGYTGKSLSDSINEINWLIAQYPDLAYAYSYRAQLLFAQGDIMQAIADLDTAIPLGAHVAETYYKRAIYRHAQSSPNLSLVLSDLDMSIQLDSQYAEAYNARGSVHLSLNLPSKALLDWKKYQQLTNSQDPKLLELISSLESIP